MLTQASYPLPALHQPEENRLQWPIPEDCVDNNVVLSDKVLCICVSVKLFVVLAMVSACEWDYCFTYVRNICQ